VTVFALALVEVSEHWPVATLAEQLASPSLTVTVPVGVPLPGEFAVTAQATVYVWPTTVAAVRSLVIVVVVLALSTVCERAPDVLPLKLPSPL
jgi:hypothetical protein